MKYLKIYQLVALFLYNSFFENAHCWMTAVAENSQRRLQDFDLGCCRVNQ